MLDVSNVPSRIGYYLAGFTDGEGSFNVSFRLRKDYRNPWKISLCFNVSQRDELILKLFQSHIQCGTMRQRRDGVWYYEVNTLTSIIRNVIPFFNRFGFLSAKKKRDFDKFVCIAQLMSDKQHLEFEGVQAILAIREEMNDGGKRKYSADYILKRIQESSETTRQTL